MTRDHLILIALSTITATACLPAEDLFVDNRPVDWTSAGDGGSAPDGPWCDGGGVPHVKPPVPVPFGPKAIAYEYGSVSHDVDPGPGTTVSSSAVGGHTGPAPDTLFI
ncbi:MAG: hypothetical protein VB934_06785, partial [Polyangiaceae bacterium]